MRVEPEVQGYGRVQPRLVIRSSAVVCRQPWCGGPCPPLFAFGGLRHPYLCDTIRHKKVTIMKKLGWGRRLSCPGMTGKMPVPLKSGLLR